MKHALKTYIIATTIQTMPIDTDQKYKLIKHLLACPALGEASNREQLTSQLPTPIRYSLERALISRADIDMLGLVDTCLNYYGGLYELYSLVAFFDAGAIPFQKLEKFLFSSYLKEVRDILDEEENEEDFAPDEPLDLPTYESKKPAKPSEGGETSSQKLMLTRRQIKIAREKKATALAKENLSVTFNEWHEKYAPPQANTSLPSVNLKDRITNNGKNPRLVLLGEPGAGKTTALRKLFREFSTSFLAQRWVSDNADGNTLPRLPIYVKLANWNNLQESLEEFLQKQVLNSVSAGASVAFLAELLPGLLRSGRLLLLLDGLNEAPSLTWQDKEGTGKTDQRILELAKLGKSLYTNTACVLSCRVNDFRVDGKVLTDEWDYLVVAPLDDATMCRFVLASYTSHPSQVALANRLLNAIFDSKNKIIEGIRELIRQPFYLVKLINYYDANDNQLPDNRAELLTSFVDGRLAAEIKKGIPLPVNLETLKERLSLLAFNMTDAERVVEKDIGQVAAWLFYLRPEMSREQRQGKVSYSKPVASPSEEAEAEKILTLARSIKLLDRHASGGVRFNHQLLQEFFAALYLKNHAFNDVLPSRILGEYRFQEVEKLWDELVKIFDYAYSLLIDEVTPIKLKIEAIFIFSHYTNHTKASLVLPLFISGLIHPNIDMRYRAAWVLGKYSEVLGAERAIEPLIQALRDSERSVRSSAVEALGKYSGILGAERAIEPLIQALRDSERSVRSSAAEALGELGIKETLDLY